MSGHMIKGFTKVSMLDYPGKIAAVIFTGGCNFRCGFCHNPELVNNDPRLTPFEEDYVLGVLEEKKKWIDGVCITGGEPTLEKDMPQLIKKIKDLGLLVKFDTNGTNPVMLKQLIDEKLVDYVAMDIKTSKEKYEQACEVKVNMDNIEKSIGIIMASDVEYEFRTTAVPGIVDKNDIEQISEWIKGAKKYAIQQFIPIKTLNPKYADTHHYHIPVLKEMGEIAKKNIKEVEVRA